MRILIADDHAILRKGLIEILVKYLDNTLQCGEAKDAEELLVQVRNHPWDLVILDITMPGRSGLDVLAGLKLEQPKLRVLILSMQPEEEYAQRALKAGASGYVSKASEPQELIHAIRRVLAGGRYVSHELADTLAYSLSRKSEGPIHETLSNRELEVFKMIALGIATSQIAESLHLSVTTVGTYRSRILEKMGMTTNSELIRYALLNHLV